MVVTKNFDTAELGTKVDKLSKAELEANLESEIERAKAASIINNGQENTIRV